jgi:hypothetical protein
MIQIYQNFVTSEIFLSLEGFDYSPHREYFWKLVSVFSTLNKFGGFKRRKILGAPQETTLDPLFLIYNSIFECIKVIYSKTRQTEIYLF